MKLKVILCIVFITVLSSCNKNISVKFDPLFHIYGESYIYQTNEVLENYCIENNYFELIWKDGFGINYFDFKPISRFVLYSYGELKPSDINVDSIEFSIQEINYKQIIEKNNLVIHSYGDNSISIHILNCMNDIFTAKEDLIKLQQIKNISVIINIKLNNQLYKLDYQFVPNVIFSNALFDNLMSI